MRLGKLALCLLLLCGLLLVGCGNLAPTSDHPAEETGIRLSDAYEALYYNYQETYDNVNEEQQAFMRKEIAPTMNELKDKIMVYNETVLMKGEAPERRRTLFSQLRELSAQIQQIKESEE